MKERPILFSAPMVRALLDGNKTQTRRVLKRQPDEHHWQRLPGYELKPSKIVTINDRSAVKFYHAIPQNREWDTALDWLLCQYGHPGDRLWVREAWGYFDPDGTGEDYDRDHNEEGKSGPCTAYSAEMLQEGSPLRDYWRRRIAYKATFAEQKYGMGPVGPSRWRPSIHMPRWASRITLEITGVRVERLQAISMHDVGEEGIGALLEDPDSKPGQAFSQAEHAAIAGFPGRITPEVKGYAALWEQINGAGSWDANPWVWVVEFKNVTPQGGDTP